MAQSRYYSATAQPTVLTAGITSGSTVINVMATTGFPASTPFILALDYNTPSEEIVLVTVAAGTNLTVTRAYDGTSATSHNAGAGVRHTWTAMDGNDSRAHEAASTGVHGINVSSSVVGTIDSQTLISKTLTAPAINGTIGGTASFANVTGHLGGLAAGSTGQFTVDVNGRPASTTFTSGYAVDSTARTSANTSYVDVSTLSTTAVVPPSGKVLVTCQLTQKNDTASQFTLTDALVTGTTSGILRSPNDATACRILFSEDSTGALTFTQSSANPGETLTVKLQSRVTGGTGTLTYRNISVIPLVG